MTAQTMTISDAAKELNVTTVRIHGLLSDGKLVLAEQPIKKGEKFVKAVTVESINKYAETRKAGTNGTRQYILSLDADQVAELEKAGYSLKPRFQKKED